MTMTQRAMDWLTARSLDVEVAGNYGLASGRFAGGEALFIPHYRNGQIVGRKLRLLDEGKNGWRWAPGSKCCFWNEDVLKDRSLDGQPLIITEGHWDALAAIQCGFPRTISVPNGAPPPNPEKADIPDFEYVRDVIGMLTPERFPAIILATDADGPGSQLMHDLSVQLGRARCKFVSYDSANLDGDLASFKDTNDVLKNDGAAAVVAMFILAKFMTLPGVHFLSEMAPLPPDTIYEIGSELTGLRLLSENYKMRLGDFTVVTGIPGYGKTTFVNDVVCRVVDRYDLRAAWASFEQRPERDHKRTLRAWYKNGDDYEDTNAQADAWIDDHHVFIVPDEDEDVTLEWLLEAAAGAVVRHQCKILVIDPWNEIEHRRSPGESETEYTGWAIRQLKRFARKFQVHLILVAHPAKLQRVNGKYHTPSLYEISGSANFYNKADVGIVIHKETKDTTLVRVAKVRYHESIGKPGEVSVSFNSVTRRFVENERIA